MIIIKLFGGLGNQMFQYAAAKALSINTDTELKLDISHFRRVVANESLRDYRLDVFPNIKEFVATKHEISKLVHQYKFTFFNKIHKNFNKKILNINKKYKVEKSLSYSPILLDRKKSIYLDGYWQSEKYFDSVGDIIRDCFNLDFLRYHENLKPFIDKIQQQEASVSIHIRRGDYLSNPSANTYHGVADLSYYEKSIHRLITSASSDLSFFVFSDDISWCKKNFIIPYKHFYIDTGTDYHDLYLMSICKHHIIANSTFSWWGAWLNNNNDKIIIAPKKWFAHQSPNDILPLNWLTE